MEDIWPGYPNPICRKTDVSMDPKRPLVRPPRSFHCSVLAGSPPLDDRLNRHHSSNDEGRSRRASSSFGSWSIIDTSPPFSPIIEKTRLKAIERCPNDFQQWVNPTHSWPSKEIECSKKPSVQPFQAMEVDKKTQTAAESKESSICKTWGDLPDLAGKSLRIGYEQKSKKTSNHLTSPETDGPAGATNRPPRSETPSSSSVRKIYLHLHDNLVPQGYDNTAVDLEGSNLEDEVTGKLFELNRPNYAGQNKTGQMQPPLKAFEDLLHTHWVRKLSDHEITTITAGLNSSLQACQSSLQELARSLTRLDDFDSEYCRLGGCLVKLCFALAIGVHQLTLFFDPFHECYWRYRLRRGSHPQNLGLEIIGGLRRLENDLELATTATSDEASLKSLRKNDALEALKQGVGFVDNVVSVIYEDYFQFRMYRVFLALVPGPKTATLSTWHLLKTLSWQLQDAAMLLASFSGTINISDDRLMELFGKNVFQGPIAYTSDILGRLRDATDAAVLQSNAWLIHNMVVGDLGPAEPVPLMEECALRYIYDGICFFQDFTKRLLMETGFRVHQHPQDIIVIQEAYRLLIIDDSLLDVGEHVNRLGRVLDRESEYDLGDELRRIIPPTPEDMAVQASQ